MSDAIDNADVMLYGVSEKYKESGNCRLEANYAHQQDVDMIPLLVEKGYRPKGWLGLIMGEPRLKAFGALRACATNSPVDGSLGTRMYYSFYAAESDDDAAFEKRLDAVVREIGNRGRPLTNQSVAEGIPPVALSLIHI